MSTPVMQQVRTALNDRRFQLGGVVALSIAALLGCGIMAVAVAAKPEPARAEMADVARLTVVTEAPRRMADPLPQGQLATLDPSQAAEAQQVSEPVEPALQAILDQEKQEQVQALAEQRAFDARMQADLAGTPTEDPDRPAATPVSTEGHGATSNSTDIADND